MASLPKFLHYEAISVIDDTGGTAVVYRGRPVGSGIGIDIDVAMKHWRPQSGELMADLRRKFLTEARILRDFDHPNIVGIRAAGEVEDRPMLVMELLGGASLESELQTAVWAKRSLRERVSIVTTLCGAVAYAHARRVVHGDIKPANARFNHEGTIKLIDFGIARRPVTDPNRTVPLPSRTIPWCTPEYSGPEVLFGPPDERSDVFSLGVLLFELLALTRPFTNSAAEHFARTRNGVVPDVRQYRADCPLALAEILKRALAERPADRFQSAADMLTALKSVEQGFDQPVTPPRASVRSRLPLLTGAVVLSAALLLWQSGAFDRTQGNATALPPRSTASPPATSSASRPPAVNVAPTDDPRGATGEIPPPRSVEVLAADTAVHVRLPRSIVLHPQLEFEGTLLQPVVSLGGWTAIPVGALVRIQVLAVRPAADPLPGAQLVLMGTTAYSGQFLPLQSTVCRTDERGLTVYAPCSSPEPGTLRFRLSRPIEIRLIR